MKNVTNPTNGQTQTLRQKKWHFGPDWPGKRCGAQTRRGTKCQKPALNGKARCQLHGGRAGAPPGKRNGAYKHGEYTKEAIEQHRAAAARIRTLSQLGKTLGMFD